MIEARVNSSDFDNKAFAYPVLLTNNTDKEFNGVIMFATSPTTGFCVFSTGSGNVYRVGSHIYNKKDWLVRSEGWRQFAGVVTLENI